MEDKLEIALVSRLETVEGLAGRVEPLLDITYNTGPLAVYARAKQASGYDLQGCTGLQTAEFTVHALDNTYRKMTALATQVAEVCQALQGYKQNGLWIEAVTVEQTTPDLREVHVNLFRRTYVVTLEYQLYEGV